MRLRPAPQRTRGVPGSGHAQGAPSAAPVTRREARQALARRLPTSLPSCWARSCRSGFKASSSILVAGEFHSKVCATVQRRRVRPRGYSNTLTAGCARALPRASVVAGLLGRLRPRPPGTAPRGKERPGPCRPRPRRSRRSVLRGGRGLQRPCPPRMASPTASVRSVKAPHQSVFFRASSFPLSDPRLCTLGHSSETMSIVRDVFAAGCAFAPGLTRGLVNAGSEQLRGPHIIRPAVGTGGSELRDAKTSFADKGGGGRLPTEWLVGGLCVFLCSRAAAFGTRTGLRGRGAGSEGPGTATSLLPGGAGPAATLRSSEPGSGLRWVPAPCPQHSCSRQIHGICRWRYFHRTVFLCVIHESGCSLPLGGGRCRRGEGGREGAWKRQVVKTHIPSWAPFVHGVSCP